MVETAYTVLLAVVFLLVVWFGAYVIFKLYKGQD